MPTIPLIVFNLTNDPLRVFGQRGGDLNDVVRDDIPPGLGRIVGTYETPGALSDNWDWIYLQNVNTKDRYQIYIEWRRPGGATFALFGYYDETSSQSNANPSPFPDGYAMTNFVTSGSDPGWATYVLVKTPPARFGAKDWSKLTWLTQLPDDVPIGALNLPGSHDSAAQAGLGDRIVHPLTAVLNPMPALTSQDDPGTHMWARQNDSIAEQLEAGIRYLDIRIGVEKTDLIIVHGAVSAGSFNDYGPLAAVFDACRAFLAKYPGEFIVLGVDINAWIDVPANDTAALNRLEAFLQRYPVLIGADLPRVAEARGKIVLLNRITPDLRFGVPFGTNFAGDTYYGLLPRTASRHFDVYVQVQYENLGTIQSLATQANFQYFVTAATASPPMQDAKTAAVLTNNGAGTWATKLPDAVGIRLGITDIKPAVVDWIGQMDVIARKQRRLGWASFDFATERYNCRGSNGDEFSTSVVELVIDSNFGYSRFPVLFTRTG